MTSITNKLHDVLIAIGFGGILAVTAPMDAVRADATSSSSVGNAISDTAITAKVKASLADDSALKSSGMSVTTNDGVVSLTGTAASSAGKAAAERIARSIHGVKSVDNELQSPTVADRVASDSKAAADKTGEVATDSWITTKVKSKLLADDMTKSFDISVTTTDGTVALSGSLPSADSITRAVALTKEIKGVKHVDSADLTIASK